MIVLKATQEQILASLQSVAGIVERRHTLPILANVMLRKTGVMCNSPPAILKFKSVPRPRWAETVAISAPRLVHAN